MYSLDESLSELNHVNKEVETENLGAVKEEAAVYKIIFSAYTSDGGCSFDMLKERFNTREAAANFIKETLLPELLSELDEDNPESVSYKIDVIEDEEVYFTLYSHGEIYSITEYKIREV